MTNLLAATLGIAEQPPADFRSIVVRGEEEVRSAIGSAGWREFAPVAACSKPGRLIVFRGRV